MTTTRNRLRYNDNYGTIENNPLAIGGTSLKSAALPAVSASTDYYAITIDPLEEVGAKEIVFCANRAVSGASYTVDIERGKFGTTAREHQYGEKWVLGAYREDLPRAWNRPPQIRLVASGDYTFSSVTYDYLEAETDITGGRLNLEEGEIARLVCNGHVVIAGADTLHLDFEVTQYSDEGTTSLGTANLRTAYDGVVKIVGPYTGPFHMEDYFQASSGVRQIFAEPVAKVSGGSAVFKSSASYRGPLMVMHSIGFQTQTVQ